MQRVTAIFHGRVQGVGFRASTRVVAQQMGLKGYVTNLADGTVKVVAEGETETLKNFLRVMKSKEILGQRIVDELEVSYEEATEEFERFEIKK